MEGDSKNYFSPGHSFLFLSTPSGWRATSNSSTRCIGRREFLSTPSGWRATISFSTAAHRSNFYPRPPGGGRQSSLLPHVGDRLISIHALRVEGDAHPGIYVRTCNISIHALRVEGDGSKMYTEGLAEAFLSTPSGWRATLVKAQIEYTRKISIHALRVEGDSLCEECHNKMHPISIHALRVEGDSAS